jgi:hypothetical protein
MKETEDPTFWFIFLPAVVTCTVPGIITAFHVIRGVVVGNRLAPAGLMSASMTDRLRIGAEMKAQHPELADIQSRAFRWMKITILTWLTVFGIVAAFALTCIMLERKQQTAPNTTSEGIRQPADGSPKPSM